MNCGSLSQNWYAVYTKPGHEDSVAANLLRADIRTLNPKIKKTKFVKNRYRALTRPLFPCYIFAEFDPSRFYYLVKYTRGVSGIVGGIGAPWPIGEEIIKAIESGMDEDGAIAYREPIMPGDGIKVIDGPLKGFMGIFERKLTDKERVVVLLDAIEYRARVEMERSFIGRASI